MKTSSNKQIKRGRPRSNTKQYCVRMLPETHRILSKMAARNRMRLGNWFNHLASARNSDFAALEEIDEITLLRLFEFALDEAVVITNTIHELIDLDPSKFGNEKLTKKMYKLANKWNDLSSWVESEKT